MSSPLDGRIRVIAEQVLASAAGAVVVADGEVSLQQQITDLHEHLHVAATTIARLEQRIEALEGAVGPVVSAPKRAVRKTTGE